MSWRRLKSAAEARPGPSTSDDSSQPTDMFDVATSDDPATGSGELSQPNQRFSMAGQCTEHAATAACNTALAKCASSGKLASLSTHCAGRATAAPRLARACSVARARAASMNFGSRLVIRMKVVILISYNW